MEDILKESDPTSSKIRDNFLTESEDGNIIDILPCELLMMIFDYCGFKSRLNLRLINKKCNQIYAMRSEHYQVLTLKYKEHGFNLHIVHLSKANKSNVQNDYRKEKLTIGIKKESYDSHNQMIALSLKKDFYVEPKYKTERDIDSVTRLCSKCLNSKTKTNQDSNSQNAIDAEESERRCAIRKFAHTLKNAFAKVIEIYIRDLDEVERSIIDEALMSNPCNRNHPGEGRWPCETLKVSVDDSNTIRWILNRKSNMNSLIINNYNSPSPKLYDWANHLFPTYSEPLWFDAYNQPHLDEMCVYRNDMLLSRQPSFNVQLNRYRCFNSVLKSFLQLWSMKETAILNELNFVCSNSVLDFVNGNEIESSMDIEGILNGILHQDFEEHCMEGDEWLKEFYNQFLNHHREYDVKKRYLIRPSNDRLCQRAVLSIGSNFVNFTMIKILGVKCYSLPKKSSDLS